MFTKTEQNAMMFNFQFLNFWLFGIINYQYKIS